MVKECLKCYETKNLVDFERDGKGKFSDVCRECQQVNLGPSKPEKTRNCDSCGILQQASHYLHKESENCKTCTINMCERLLEIKDLLSAKVLKLLNDLDHFINNPATDFLNSNRCKEAETRTVELAEIERDFMRALSIVHKDVVVCPQKERNQKNESKGMEKYKKLKAGLERSAMIRENKRQKEEKKKKSKVEKIHNTSKDKITRSRPATGNLTLRRSKSPVEYNHQNIDENNNNNNAEQIRTEEEKLAPLFKKMRLAKAESFVEETGLLYSMRASAKQMWDESGQKWPPHMMEKIERFREQEIRFSKTLKKTRTCQECQKNLLLDQFPLTPQKICVFGFVCLSCTGQRAVK